MAAEVRVMRRVRRLSEVLRLVEKIQKKLPKKEFSAGFKNASHVTRRVEQSFGERMNTM